MSLEGKIKKLVALGDYIREDNEALNAVKVQARLHNPWFTPENIDYALQSIAANMMDEKILTKWVANYSFRGGKKVGLILAGNIPLVGFHDMLCCYLAGHKSIVKTSSKDSILTLHLLEQLEDPEAFTVVERLGGMEAVIATGSNQSAKQFEKYFHNYPNIIRRNRNAIAVLAADITDAEIVELGKDVFTYFGLGCRNVSKIYIPEGFDKVKLMEILHDRYKHLINHSKYKNNYDYNHAIYLMNADDFLASGAVLLRRHNDIVSRIACLHYEEYADLAVLERDLLAKADQIQCISANVDFEELVTLPLGYCQKPEIDDYADGVDTMDFLSKL